MSQKSRNPGGRPKGYPKTGGRIKGVRNKKNVRLRERFAEAGFDFVLEVMETIKKIDTPNDKMDALLKLTPYFMQRLRDDVEAPEGGGELGDDSEHDITTEDLLKVLGK